MIGLPLCMHQVRLESVLIVTYVCPQVLSQFKSLLVLASSHDMQYAHTLYAMFDCCQNFFWTHSLSVLLDCTAV